MMNFFNNYNFFILINIRKCCNFFLNDNQTFYKCEMNSRKNKNNNLYFKKFSIIFIRIRNNIYYSFVVFRFNLKFK